MSRHHRVESDGDANDANDAEVVQLKKNVDTNLPPIVSYGFDDWNRRFDSLGERGDRNQARDTFALTGNFTEEGHRYRARLDIDRYRLGYNIELGTTCDIDSVLGMVMGDFPISQRATFIYYMLADFRFTLSTNLHLPPIEILNGEETECSAPVHHIPNTRFGELGRLLIRLCFPALYNAQQRKTKPSPNYVGNGRLQTFYDRAVRPATSTVLPEEVRHQWPSQFANELFRAAPNRRGAGEAPVRGRPLHQHTGREVHGQYFNDWLAEIRRLVDLDQELSFAQGFFLLVEGKGLKYTNLSSHDPPEAALADPSNGDLIDNNNPRTLAIVALLHDLVPADFEPGEWYIDIATTISGRHDDPEGRPVSLFVDSELHPEIINHFSEKPLANCATWVRARSGGYQMDEVAHVGRFAGFRINFDTPGAHGIRYLQVYTTNKSVTYHIDGLKRAKRTSPNAVMSDWATERDTHLIPMADAFRDAASTHPVAVRFESRVPFEMYPYVHTEIGWGTLERWLFATRNTQIWGFMWRRAIGCTSLLGLLCGSQNARSRFSLDQLPEVGSLLILLVYIANALVNRPDEGGTWDEVRDSGCVHKLVNGDLVPIRPLGIYYLHSLRFPRNENQLPRLSSLRTISRAKIVYLCSSTREERNELAVLRLIQANQKHARDDEQVGDAWGVAEPGDVREAQPHRPNKQRRVAISLAEDAPDVFGALLPDRELHVRYDSEDDDDEVREAAPALSQQVSTIVHTFPLQIFAKAPNKKGGEGSWCSMRAYQRTEVGFDIFVDSSAPRRYFPSHYSYKHDAERWNASVRALFPTLSEKHEMGKVQNLSQMTVWADWEMLLANTAPEAARRVVLETRKYVSDRWRWLPFYTKKKLWVTGTPASMRSCDQVGEAGGPWIVFNPKFHS